MPLLVDVRPGPSGDESERLQACFGDNLRAGLLQVLGPVVPMSPAAGAKVQLEVVMSGHDMGSMDFGGTKQIVAITLVSAEELDSREAGANFAHALHVKGSLDEGKIPVQRQGEPTSNAPILGVENVASIFGKLPGLLTLRDVGTISGFAEGWLAPFGRQVGRNDKVVFESLPSDAKLLLEPGDKVMAGPMGNGCLLSQKVGIPIA
jgi:hypothetical protein